MFTKRLSMVLVGVALTALPQQSAFAGPSKPLTTCSSVGVLDVGLLGSDALSSCDLTGRLVVVADFSLTVPEAGEGVGQAAVRTADSDRALPTTVLLYHSKSGGVAVSVDGSQPVGAPSAIKEMADERAKLRTPAQAGSLVPMAKPTWCGSVSQYDPTGQKWTNGIYQWKHNSSGRPSSMTEVQRAAAFDAAEGYIEADDNACGGSNTSLSVGKVGSTTKTVGVKDGVNTMGWKALSSGTLALTTWWFVESSTQEADMAYSTSVSWSASTGTVPSAKHDLISVAVHELGHAVGLGHVSSTPKQVMYPYFNKGENRRVKRSGDLYGLALIY